jgi:hypothetical protein
LSIQHFHEKFVKNHFLLLADSLPEFLKQEITLSYRRKDQEQVLNQECRITGSSIEKVIIISEPK